MRTTISTCCLIGLYLVNCRFFFFLHPSERLAVLYSAVMWEKQEDALLHCDSAINTIIPHQSGESSLEIRASCIRDAQAL